MIDMQAPIEIDISFNRQLLSRLVVETTAILHRFSPSLPPVEGPLLSQFINAAIVAVLEKPKLIERVATDMLFERYI